MLTMLQMRAYNKMHIGFKVQIEWGIGGQKMGLMTKEEGQLLGIKSAD